MFSVLFLQIKFYQLTVLDDGNTDFAVVGIY